MDQIIQVTDLQGPSISTNSTFLPTMLTNSTNLNHSATISHQVIPTIHQTNLQPPNQPPYYCKTTSPSSERKRIALNQVNFNLMVNKFLQKLSVKSKLIVALPSKLNHKAFKKPEFLCFLNLPKTTEQIKSNSLINLINNPSLSLSHIFPTHPAGMIHAATSIHFQPMERPKQQLLMQITSKVITPNQLQPNSNFISSEVVTPNQLQPNFKTPTLMQIRSEWASPTICRLPSPKPPADPGKDYLPTPNPTLMQIRSECAPPTLCKIMPSFKTIADP